jgi:hypothetical protein
MLTRLLSLAVATLALGAATVAAQPPQLGNQVYIKGQWRGRQRAAGADGWCPPAIRREAAEGAMIDERTRMLIRLVRCLFSSQV